MFIWVIKDGILLAKKSFLNYPVRDDLVSGLLAAINSFVIAEFNELIDNIEMGGLNWVYDYYEKEFLLFVAADSKDVKIETIKSRLNFIKELFIREYVNGKDLKDWDGNVKIFEPFEEKLEKIYYNWLAAENLETYADLFDIIAIFQQILNLIHNIIKNQINNHRKERVIRYIEFFTRRFKERLDILKTEEMKKISYSREKGFNIFAIDPNKCDIIVVKKQLKNYFARIIKFLKEELGPELSLIFFNEQKIFTFIFKNSNLLKKHQLEDFLLQHFLKT